MGYTATVIVDNQTIPLLTPRPSGPDVQGPVIINSSTLAPLAVLRTGQSPWNIGLTVALAAGGSGLTDFAVYGIRASIFNDPTVSQSSALFQLLHEANQGHFSTPTHEFYVAYGLTITSTSTSQAPGTNFDIGMQVGTWWDLLLMAASSGSQNIVLTASAEKTL